MEIRAVPFGFTEEALRLLRATHADFSQLPVPSMRGRIRGGSNLNFGPYDFQHVRAQSEYLRQITIVEAFVDTCCNHLFDLRTKGMNLLVQNLAAAAMDQASSSWESRKNAFNLYHGIALGACAKFSDVSSAVQVRNAIAHGLGSLTKRQQNPKDIAKIESIGVRLRGRALVIDSVALNRCVNSCTQFVEDVDRRILH